MFFFPFLCSGIPGLALGILKMLIRVCLRDVLQPLPAIEFQPVCTVFTVSRCYLQILAMHKKVLS